MHRRNRHLNPKDAGAIIALDARFLNLSDGASVSTWTNRTGTNNLTQATSTNQPTFKTAIKGGCPVVRFDASNDFLSVGGSINFTNQFTFIVALKNNSITNITIIAKESDDIDFVLWGGLGLGISKSGVAWIVNQGSSSDTSWKIVSGNLSGTSSGTASIYRDGTRLNTNTTVTISLTNRPTFYVGRQGGGAYFDGDMGIIIAIQSYISDSLRKRLERSLALIYKIACN